MNRYYIIISGLIFTLLFAGNGMTHGIADSDKQRMAEGGYLDYIALGAEHMVTGYDHLLFLFGVMFFLTRLVDIVKFVTAFTVGHTITLISATYLGITINYYLIDAIIAVTVIYKGFENLDGFRKYLNIASPSLLWMVFAFGLIHGFGLSTRLQQLPLAADTGFLGRILSFNLGVEIGQILALIIMWLFLRLWQNRQQFDLFSRLANSGLMAAGALLLLMQLHGFGHSTYRNSFPLNSEHHEHIHEHMVAMVVEPAASLDTNAEENGGLHSHDGGPLHSHDEVQEQTRAGQDTGLHSHDGGSLHRHDDVADQQKETNTAEQLPEDDPALRHQHAGKEAHQHTH